MNVGELAGVAAAVLSSALGGAAVGATRYVAGAIDPIALGAFRFGIGFCLLLPMALLGSSRERWPARRDWPATVALGLLFFGLFPLLFNASLHYTSAARGALSLSALPLLTMTVAGVLRIEPFTRRKTVGVLVAMTGVALSLLSDLRTAPPGAWRGDLLMLAAALCMAFYSVGSRAVIRRSGPLSFTVLAMAAGALCLASIAWHAGSFAPVARFGMAQWLAVAYLGVFGGAIGFFLWAFALGRTTPTRVAISVTVNPVAAGLVGAWLLAEPLRWGLVAGLLAVLAGIVIAATGGAAVRVEGQRSDSLAPPQQASRRLR
ncbi:DMT family transporter [Variovorax atrisoli]|uniref:DMT family transporter n=1 Tax=Variovorax atrisoli TaxID=3394203 RepID=UPI003394ED66